ncbi:hypothetical protein [Kitasatospora sp. MAP5-34]|nr:hypothetical protein [Kitasatospora sp. MAP5-34]
MCRIVVALTVLTIAIPGFAAMGKATHVHAGGVPTVTRSGETDWP